MVLLCPQAQVLHNKLYRHLVFSYVSPVWGVKKIHYTKFLVMHAHNCVSVVPSKLSDRRRVSLIPKLHPPRR